MNPILFGIVFGIIMIFMVVNSFSVKTVLPVAKAGNVKVPYRKDESVRRTVPKFINVAGKRIDVTGFIPLYVHGNSMKKYKIKDKDFVFIKLLQNCKDIVGYPVLAFNIINPEPNDAVYKLRKFVYLLDSIQNVDWSSLYEINKERITISKDEFIKQCKDKAEQHKEILVGKVVLSETFDEKEEKDHYSLHPLTAAYGTVEYAA